jgi:hypothetical protein
MTAHADFFGAPIFTYSRAQAIRDGVLIDVSATAREAGIRYPVALTRAVWDAHVAVAPGVIGQDEAGRLWDVLWMFARSARGISDRQGLPWWRYVPCLGTGTREPAPPSSMRAPRAGDHNMTATRPSQHPSHCQLCQKPWRLCKGHGRLEVAEKLWAERQRARQSDTLEPGSPLCRPEEA